MNLSLPFDKNQLTFQFAGVDWKASHKVHFTVMLKGLDAKWRDQGGRNFATYRNLEPGDYIFKVKATRDNGIWSNTFEYPFEIRPPWYETKAYYIAQTIFLGLLLFFAVFLNRSGKGGEWIIIFTFVTVITIFEFVLVLVEPYIDQYSSGIPILKVVVNVMIALSLNPAEKFIRERIARKDPTKF